MQTTVVTAFYHIESKFPVETYLGWIRYFMQADLTVVIYGDDSTVRMLQSIYPETPQRQYRVKRIADFVTSAWSWEADYAMDGEKAVGHSIDLYKVWNEKPFFVRDVVQSNPYRTDTFAWVDIGCVREEKTLWPMHGFPDARRFDPRKVTFLAIEPFLVEEKRDLDVLDERFRDKIRLGGGIFAGGADALRRFADLHYRTIAEAKSRGVFAGKDQNLLAFEVLRYPDLFEVLPSLPRPGYDPWFQLLWRWASDEILVR